MQRDLRGAFEQVLRRRRSALIREATDCEVALQAMAGDVASELEESAQDEELCRVLSRLDDRERREITEINDALDRMVDGHYGRCVGCDATIDVDRLAALPETPLCIRCAGARAMKSAM